MKVLFVYMTFDHEVYIEMLKCCDWVVLSAWVCLASEISSNISLGWWWFSWMYCACYLTQSWRGSEVKQLYSEWRGQGGASA